MALEAREREDEDPAIVLCRQFKRRFDRGDCLLRPSLKHTPDILCVTRSDSQLR